MLFIIPLSIMTEFRIINRLICETYKGLTRTGLMNVIIIGTMAAILSIFGCLFHTSLGISNFVQNLGSEMQISAYLKDGASADKVSKNIVNDIAYIKEVRIIPKEKAWDDLKKQMDVPSITNPLPDTLRIKVTDNKHIDMVVARIKAMRGVESIQYAQQLAIKIQTIADITKIAALVILVCLGSLTLFIISNTIQLVIQARKQEIEILRMMGVSNWYIKSPYILQGAFYGLTGALISLIPLYVAQNYLNQFFNFFQVGAGTSVNSDIVVFTLLMMGVLVGSGGSIISVRKYLKV